MEKKKKWDVVKEVHFKLTKVHGKIKHGRCGYYCNCARLGSHREPAPVPCDSLERSLLSLHWLKLVVPFAKPV